MSDKALTVSVSQGRTAQQHDRRDYTPKNAARVLEPNNVCVVRVDDEVAAFNDFFEPAISAYNAKQKRADRKKSFDYHAEIVERRARSKDPDHEVKPFYEYVVGLGDRNGVMAVTDATFDNATWRRLKDGYTDDDGTEHAPDYRAADAYVKEHLNDHPDREMVKAALTAYMETLQERYPNFRFVCIEGHDDEPNGTFHFHIRFFPVGEGYKNGMRQQCGLNKALEQMGFKGSKGMHPITQWQNAVKRDHEEIVLKSCGYDRAYGDGRKERMEQDAYVLSQDLEEMRIELEQVQLDAYRKEAAVRKREQRVERRESALDERESAITKREGNMDEEVKSKVEAELASKRKALDDREAKLDARVDATAKREAKVSTDEQETARQRRALALRKKELDAREETLSTTAKGVDAKAIDYERKVAAFNASGQRVDALARYIANAEAIAAVGDGLHAHRVLCMSTPSTSKLVDRLEEQQRMIDALTEIKPGVPCSSGDRQLSL